MNLKGKMMSILNKNNKKITRKESELFTLRLFLILLKKGFKSKDKNANSKEMLN